MRPLLLLHELQRLKHNAQFDLHTMLPQLLLHKLQRLQHNAQIDLQEMLPQLLLHELQRLQHNVQFDLQEVLQQLLLCVLRRLQGKDNNDWRLQLCEGLHEFPTQGHAPRESETGLYICMNTFLGLGKLYVEEHFKKTGNGVFLHIKRRRKTIQKASEDPPPLKKPTRLAIEFVEVDFLQLDALLVVNPHRFPIKVNLSAIAIIEAEDALKMEEAALATGSWEGDKRIVSKHAENLLQLDNGKKIPPTGWKCEMCELTTNLWLNLTDGAILCGRRFFDGSGGNNHAVDYYNITKYPLAVKLGTITADGADVYSYDEDDMVEDPYLTKHLAHFGINIASLQKTEKTMVELEIDLNQKIGEWDVIQESGSQLTPLYGPGCTGMRNLGNSCYMNSVMQVIFTIPDFQEKYFDCRDAIFAGAPVNPTSDFNVQMAKLAHGLLSGEYSKPPNETEIDEEYMPPPKGIRPQMFKTLVGRGHPEFSSKRQQDAEEYFLHLINFIERQGPHLPKATDCFKYKVEEKVKCVASGKVRYTYRTDYVFAVPVHLDAAINKENGERKTEGPLQ
uniref:ubiquitinyl hydrolase 1 n=1 Tax=Octopus bimaculoides TaxID=37653 RepID=A0A0L8HCH8_OCTBM